MLEKDVVKKIYTFWKKQGAIIYKFHGNAFSASGAPDLIICYEGYFIAIEVKVGKSKPRPLQLRHLEIINDWGKGIALWMNENNYINKCNEILELIKSREI